MGRAQKVTGSIGRYRPTCAALVRLSVQNTVTKRIRVEASQRAGREPTVCGRPAMWLVDDLPLCLNHAGQAALEILAK